MVMAHVHKHFQLHKISDLFTSTLVLLLSAKMILFFQPPSLPITKPIYFQHCSSKYFLNLFTFYFSICNLAIQLFKKIIKIISFKIVFTVSLRSYQILAVHQQSGLPNMLLSLLPIKSQDIQTLWEQCKKYIFITTQII